MQKTVDLTKTWKRIAIDFLDERVDEDGEMMMQEKSWRPGKKPWTEDEKMTWDERRGSLKDNREDGKEWETS